MELILTTSMLDSLIYNIPSYFPCWSYTLCVKSAITSCVHKHNPVVKHTLCVTKFLTFVLLCFDKPHSLFIIIIITMKELGVYLTLCTLLNLSQAVPINSSLSRQTGLCEYVRQHSPNTIGAFVPQCDAHGNFLPQQCSGSTGYCWCVDIITGEEIPNTRTPPGTVPVNCGEWWRVCVTFWSLLWLCKHLNNTEVMECN